MKTITIISSLVFLSIFNFSSEKEKEIEGFKTEITTIFKLKNSETNQCYWDGGSNNAYFRRGVSCGSNTSLKVYYTNPYSYKVRVAFYLRDARGHTSGTPYVISVSPGRKVYSFLCHSNGYYSILVARYDERCRFPDYY